jgi:hypothetical protein
MTWVNAQDFFKESGVIGLAVKNRAKKILIPSMTKDKLAKVLISTQI